MFKTTVSDMFETGHTRKLFLLTGLAFNVEFVYSVSVKCQRVCPLSNVTKMCILDSISVLN